jgi:hypothetical protein
VATVVAVVALSAGCTGAGGSGTSDPGTSRTTPPPDVPVAESAACEEVRTGIDAFNLGDYDGTVEHFEAAVPLAEEQDDGSTKAGQLIEAVRYYAALDADDYPEAARSSPEFARYKAITLGQCMPVDREAPEESSGTDV